MIPDRELAALRQESLDHFGPFQIPFIRLCTTTPPLITRAVKMAVHCVHEEKHFSALDRIVGKKPRLWVELCDELEYHPGFCEFE
jgi:hypothetical protein